MTWLCVKREGVKSSVNSLHSQPLAKACQSYSPAGISVSASRGIWKIRIGEWIYVLYRITMGTFLCECTVVKVDKGALFLHCRYQLSCVNKGFVLLLNCVRDRKSVV